MFLNFKQPHFNSLWFPSTIFSKELAVGAICQTCEGYTYSGIHKFRRMERSRYVGVETIIAGLHTNIPRLLLSIAAKCRAACALRVYTAVSGSVFLHVQISTVSDSPPYYPA